ncbi:MAG: ATPase domain-containing protein [Acidobacteriota bacterium]
MPRRNLVKTGISGLDGILSGGIPRGNLILLEGSVGSGKTTLGVEFIFRGATEFGEPGVVVLFEVSPDKIIRDAAQLGWDLPALERAGKCKIIFTTRQVFAHELQQADSLLLEEATRIRARRIFVDGVLEVDPSRGDGGSLEARQSFQLLAEGMQRENLTAVLAAEAAVGDPWRLRRAEEAIADTVIRLRLEEMSRATVRSLEVVKSRGHDFQMGRHSFRIVDGRGLEVYRRVQAPRKSRDEIAAFDLETRVSTGVDGLDELVNGGYLVGSTTVVAGISGAGKSVMALHYLAEGARLGQRSLMFSLDEPVGQIVRNARTIGIDLKKCIDSGIVRVEYDTPQEIEIDAHFHRVEEIMAEFKPTRVVIDSLSTYGSTLGTKERTFRDFFHALVALMKEYQTAAVYNNENPDLLGMASMMGDFRMSSLVDNILLMNWIEMGESFRLGLTVAKMRANPNLRETRECEIVNGRGLRVLPRQVPAALVRPFSSYLNLLSRGPVRRPDPDAPDSGTR